MLYDGTATDVLPVRPDCDFCKARKAAIDGRTKLGCWAYMCIPCYEVQGVGLGMGKGQRLLVDED